MLKIEVFVGSDRLDLFKDESVILNKSTKDFKELDKVFSDYTQTFTIPASKNNNAIMSHWYDETIATGFNPATKKAATIEINKLPFKQGYIWLNNAIIENGKINLYEISFFSQVPNLNEIFGKDTLPELGTNLNASLDYDSYPNAITDRVGASNDVLIPLATSQRNWTLQGLKTLTSINNNEYALNADPSEKTLVPTNITDTEGRYDISLNAFTMDSSGSGSDNFIVTMITADPGASWSISGYYADDDYSAVTGAATGVQTGSAGVFLTVSNTVLKTKVAFRFGSLPDCEFQLFISSKMGSDEESTICYYDYAAIGGLRYELKPAIRTTKIIDAIETKYGLTFNSTFFATDEFRDLYTWTNREKGFGDHIYMDYVKLQDGTVIQDPLNVWSNSIGRLTIPASSGEQRVNVIINVLQSIFDDMNDLLPTPKVRLVAYNEGASGGAIDYIDFEPGQENIKEFIFPNSATDTIVTFHVKSNFPELFDWTVISSATYLNFAVEKEREEFDNDSSCKFYFTDYTYTDSFTVESLTINGGLPAQKISEFLQGLIKQFNLVIIPTAEDEFTIETFDYWMSQGTERDITKYVDNSQIQVRPAELYNQINFNYEDTSSILGQQFRDVTGVGYGNLELEIRDSYGDSISSDKFELKLPFENPSWSRLTNYCPQTTNGEVLSELLVMHYIDSELAPIQGKPINFYYAGQFNLATTGDTEFQFRKFYRKRSVSSEQYEEYNVCYQYNTKSDAYTASLNFGSEINPLTLNDGSASSPSLYNDYWSDWITDLYDLSMRRTIIKAILPINILLSLSVNDTLIVGFRKYTINSMKVDITTGEAEFELLTLVA